jgi:acetyl esterase/lipase
MDTVERRSVNPQITRSRSPRSSVIASFCLTLVVVFAISAPPASALTLRKEIVYKTVGGINLKLDVRMPDAAGPFPAIVLIHGGKGITGDKCQANLSTLQRKYVAAGFVVYTPNYRLAPPYPSNPKLSPKVTCADGSVVDVSPLQGNIWPAGQNDVMDAVRWVRANAATYKTVGTKVSAVGTSSGGTLAYMAGATGVANVSVGLSGPTYFDASWGSPAEHADYFGCTYQQCPQTWADASPLNYVTPSSSPTDIYNSANELTPKDHAEKYFSALHSAGVAAQITIIPGSKQPQPT